MSKTTEVSLETFVARQPIFDRNRQVLAYELLFRSSWENFLPQVDMDEAASRTIVDSALTFNLPSLTGCRSAFLNVTRRVLVEDLVQLLSPDEIVVELLETIEPDEEVLAATRRLKDAGYRIALDDFVDHPRFAPLVELADYIKIDFQATSADERSRMVDRFSPQGIQLLAEKVETPGEFHEAQSAGFDLYQGYFFCTPEVVATKDVPRSKLGTLRFMKEVNREELHFDDLEGVIKADVTLSVKLLRYLNSCAFQWKSEISSIRKALVILGEGPMKRWASLLALQDLGDDKHEELTRTCLVRARFCEQMAELAKLDGRQLDLYLTGLVSGLDVLVGRPLDELLGELQVPPDVIEALLLGESAMGDVLGLARAHERGNWAQFSEIAARMEIDEADVGRKFQEATTWADSTFADED